MGYIIILFYILYIILFFYRRYQVPPSFCTDIVLIYCQDDILTHLSETFEMSLLTSILISFLSLPLSIL